MNTYDKQYLDLASTILSDGVVKSNRTGVDSICTSGLSIRHNMSDGFPLLTTKKMPFKTIAVELEGFIHGITSKQWYRDRGCKIWNEWCNPEKVEYSNDTKTKNKMLVEDDLGLIYGYQWRNFNSEGYDQLQFILNSLVNDSSNRRLLCSAWNPNHLNKQALPPCHFAWQAIVVGDRLDLVWYQRSNDLFLGCPFNVASYALLLHLLAKHANLKEGILTGHFGDIHIYKNHVDQLKIQMDRNSYELPQLETDYYGFLHWTHTDTKLINYSCHDKLYGEVAV